jgi:hypothetical protein
MTGNEELTADELNDIVEIERLRDWVNEPENDELVRQFTPPTPAWPKQVDLAHDIRAAVEVEDEDGKPVDAHTLRIKYILPETEAMPEGLQVKVSVPMEEFMLRQVKETAELVVGETAKLGKGKK